MIRVATTSVIPAQAGIHDTLQRWCALRRVVLVDACVDGRLRGHDGIGGGDARSMTTSIKTLMDAHKHSADHRAEVEASDQCACFYCMSVFSPSRIEKWIDDERTALCTNCGIDSVIGTAAGFTLNTRFLRAMHQLWFRTKTN